MNQVKCYFYELETFVFKHPEVRGHSKLLHILSLMFAAIIVQERELDTLRRQVKVLEGNTPKSILRRVDMQLNTGKEKVD